MSVKYGLSCAVFILLQTNIVLSDTCEQQTTCGACIRDPSVCAWCATDKFNGTRCKSATTDSKDWCSGSLQNPKSTAVPTDNKNFSPDLGNVIQIKPQKYKMNLRPGVPATFEFSYQPAPNYPVDMYFLLDNSRTMGDVKHVIESQSTAIYNTMSNLTTNIHLGMGSFIDKNTLPYTDVINSNETYSFRNRMKLQNDSELFRNTVKDITFGHNYDEPEGGLDALAQVIVCGQKIGWRNESRKLVVFLTDDTYHVAGDGMIGGIYSPYDGKCYTNDDGKYTKELDMDYPSVSMINKLASDEQIAVVFAVKSAVQPIYSHLSQAISGSEIETYDGKNDNIANILKNIYRNISRKIKLTTNFESGHRHKFDIKFNPNCNHDQSTSDCTLKEGEEKVIKGTITLLEYFGSDSASVDIVIKGITEKLRLDINIIKDCECAKSAKGNSTECNSGGTLKCGTCECNDDRYGVNCACVKNSASHANDNSTCIMPGDTKECSGHGSCICGNCICRKNSPYEGNFCQYNKDNCPRNNNNVCSGFGKCQNERCVCGEGWEGLACECPKSNTTCIGTNGKVCNGMGSCFCGKCTCDPTPEWDARDNQDAFCNIRPCVDCHKPQCNRLDACAQCVHSGGECAQCKHLKTSLSKQPITQHFHGRDSWNVCPDISVKIGCYTRYMYRYMEDVYLIEMMVQADEDCLESYYKYGGIAVVSLILLGIAGVVIWKWVTHARDRREYERFLKEHEADLAAAPCDNPCFMPPTTSFQNPVFRKGSVDLQH